MKQGLWKKANQEIGGPGSKWSSKITSQYRVRLMDNFPNEKGITMDCAYPGLELLPDGTFVATTYGHWSKGEMPYIVSVRFKLEELDQLKQK